MPDQNDAAVNGLTKNQRMASGILLILFTVVPAFLIIGFWPDRLPGPKEYIKPLYTVQLFHIRLAGISDSISFDKASALLIETQKNAEDSAKVKTRANNPAKVTVDITDTAHANTTPPASTAEKITAQKTSDGKIIVPGGSIVVPDESNYIHINTLLLILVALAGFLGNMIHIATSFTTFIASGKFDKSWLLWYYVRPFTAAALALAFYFVFRGGFLNMSEEVANINLYGVMTVSLLAGLFTDRATQKLKEVFDVLFKPKDERPGKLEGEFKIESIIPDELSAEGENTITIKGELLSSKKYTVTINDETATVATPGENEAVIKYLIPATQQGKTQFLLLIKDDTGTVLFRHTMTLKPPGGNGGNNNNGNGDNNNDADNQANNNAGANGNADADAH